MKLTDEELIALLENRLKEKNAATGERELLREIETLSNKLKQSEQLKSNFLSNIRNEINNPVSSVLGLSKSLMDSNEFDQKQLKHYSYLIHNEIFNLDFQMQNIFAAAEIEAGEMTLVPVQVDVNKLVLNCVESLKFKARQKEIHVATSFSADDILFCTDAAMLHLIVMNLISNSIEYSSADSEVKVAVLNNEDRLKISVKDHGLGIDKGDQPKIFERFYQLDYGSTKKHGGQGLGLSVTKELAEVLRGCLSVKSAKGRGSIFSITIPSLKDQRVTSANVENWNEFFFGNDAVM
jgi:signal transduction histidine kinase